MEMQDKSNFVQGLVLMLIGAILGAFFVDPAYALGGLDEAKTIADDIKTGLYALVGVVALIYLIYLAAMAFTEKKTWSDFGWGVVHISIAGAALALGTWAWGLFGS
jgi:hypothetical protein